MLGVELRSVCLTALCIVPSYVSQGRSVKQEPHGSPEGLRDGKRVSQDSSDSPALVRLGKGESFKQASEGRKNSQHFVCCLEEGIQ